MVFQLNEKDSIGSRQLFSSLLKHSKHDSRFSPFYFSWLIDSRFPFRLEIFWLLGDERIAWGRIVVVLPHYYIRPRFFGTEIKNATVNRSLHSHHGSLLCVMSFSLTSFRFHWIGITRREEGKYRGKSLGTWSLNYRKATRTRLNFFFQSSSSHVCRKKKPTNGR